MFGVFPQNKTVECTHSWRTSLVKKLIFFCFKLPIGFEIVDQPVKVSSVLLRIRQDFYKNVTYTTVVFLCSNIIELFLGGGESVQRKNPVSETVPAATFPASSAAIQGIFLSDPTGCWNFPVAFMAGANSKTFSMKNGRQIEMHSGNSSFSWKRNLKWLGTLGTSKRHMHHELKLHFFADFFLTFL